MPADVDSNGDRTGGTGRWNELIREFPDDPRLNSETIFALPRRLSDSIHWLAPNVMSEDDRNFEHRLRALSATGFHYRFPMFSEVMDGLVEDRDEFGWESMSARARAVRDSQLVQEFGSQDQTESARSIERRRRTEFQRRVQRALKGYVGWLVTFPQFQVDREISLLRHAAVIARCEEFLASGQDDGLPVEGGDPAAYYAAKQGLCNRWVLDAMTGNQLPDPSWPRLRNADQTGRDEDEIRGASVFILWPLLADKDLKLRQVIDAQQARRNLDHLGPWLRRNKEWGHTRLGGLLDLYVDGELAVKRRYGDRLPKLRSLGLNS